MEEDLDIKYIAGFFDGEGWVCVSKQKRKGYKNFTYVLVVGIANTYKPIIERLQAKFGGSCLPKNHKKAHWALGWQWTCTTHKALSFLRQVLPYIILKKEQAQLAIQFQEHKVNGGNKGQTEPERLEKEKHDHAIYQKLAELKGTSSNILRQQRLNETTSKDESIVQSA